jgi:hypothetical protein
MSDNLFNELVESVTEGAVLMAKKAKHLTVKCELCGKEFQQVRSDHRYCSKYCCHVAWYQREKLIKFSFCKRCGERFDQIPKGGNGLYCSDNCRRLAELERRRNGKGKGWSKGIKLTITESNTVCDMCGKSFYLTDGLIRRNHKLNFCSNDCRTRYMATHPEKFPQGAHKRGRTGKREDLNGLYVRSTWEANYARYLNWLASIGDIKMWEYEVDTFEFPVKRGSRFYTPDFKVFNKDGSIEYHEIKGYMDQRSATKLKRMNKYYPQVKILLIDKDAYYAIRANAHLLVANWESER